MHRAPQVRFLSLFVHDLDAETARLSRVLGAEPRSQTTAAPNPHPYSPAAPRVFDLGGVELALYQCDGETTHAGDIAIGLAASEGPTALAGRAAAAGGSLLLRGGASAADALAIFMLPTRHFFEVVPDAPRP